MNNFYSEVLWSLPDDKMYTIQFRYPNTSAWETTNEFNTRQKMKERAMSISEHKECRIVRISKYPPHSVIEVVFYRPAQS